MNRMVGVKFAKGNWGVVGIYATLTSVLGYHFCTQQKTRKIPYFLKKILFFRHLLVICLNFKKLYYGPLIHARNYYFLPIRSFSLLFFEFASAKIVLSSKIWSLIPQNIILTNFSKKLQKMETQLPMSFMRNIFATRWFYIAQQQPSRLSFLFFCFQLI